MEFPPKLSHRIMDLVRGGVITVDVHLARDGCSVLARCVQPHPRLGVLASTTYTLEEIVPLLDKVNLKEKPVGALPIRHARCPTSVTRNGVRNELPSGSLCYSDFNLRVEEFTLRAKAVSNKIGTAKILSRITTQPDLLGVRGARDLSEWWRESDSYQKFRLLTTSKMVGNPPRGHNGPGDGALTMLSQIACPFQDARAEIYSAADIAADYSEGNTPEEVDSEGGVEYD